MRTTFIYDIINLKRPDVSVKVIYEDNVEYLRECFLHNSKEYFKASRELAMSLITVWKVLRKEPLHDGYFVTVVISFQPRDYWYDQQSVCPDLRSNKSRYNVELTKNGTFKELISTWIPWI